MKDPPRGGGAKSLGPEAWTLLALLVGTATYLAIREKTHAAEVSQLRQATDAKQAAMQAKVLELEKREAARDTEVKQLEPIGSAAAQAAIVPFQQRRRTQDSCTQPILRADGTFEYAGPGLGRNPPLWNNSAAQNDAGSKGIHQEGFNCAALFGHSDEYCAHNWGQWLASTCDQMLCTPDTGYVNGAEGYGGYPDGYLRGMKCSPGSGGVMAGCSSCAPLSGSAESPPSPPPGPSSCNDSCKYESDGDCDDGGVGAEYDHCDYGSDCIDCGDRTMPPPPPPPVLSMSTGQPNSGANCPGGGEGITTTIENLVVNQTYALSFYQAHGGYASSRSDAHGSGPPTPLGAMGNWWVQINTPDSSPMLPGQPGLGSNLSSMPYLGAGKQVWECVSVNFTAQSTTADLVLRGSDQKVGGWGGYTHSHMVLDDVRVDCWNGIDDPCDTSNGIVDGEKDPHFSFAHGGRADFRGRDG